MLSKYFSRRVCRNMVYYKCTKDKRNARYIREGSCLMAAPLTENLKAREGIDHIGTRLCVQLRVYNPAGGNPVK